MAIKHVKVSTKPDSTDPTVIQPSDWNNEHFVLDEKGLLFAPGSETQGIDSIAANNNYLAYLRRKADGSTQERYEFVKFTELHTKDYNFPPQRLMTSIVAGILNTITIGPIPLGLNATNEQYWIAIIDDNIALRESVQILGGTAVAGTQIGEITFLPQFNHTPDTYYIASATGGIMEAYFDLPAEGGRINISPGNWPITGPIRIRRSGIELYGTPSSILTAVLPTLNYAMIQMGELGFPTKFNKLSNFVITSTDVALNNIMIDVQDQSRLTVRDIHIENCSRGIIVQGNTNYCLFDNISMAYVGTGQAALSIWEGNSITIRNLNVNASNQAGAYGLHLRRCTDVRVSDSAFYSCKNGIYLNSVEMSKDVLNTTFNNCVVRSCGSEGILIEAVAGKIISASFSNCISNNNSGHGFHIKAGAGGFSHLIQVNNCIFNTNVGNGVRVGGGHAINYWSISNTQICDNAAVDGHGIAIWTEPETNRFSLSNNILAGSQNFATDPDNPGPPAKFYNPAIYIDQTDGQHVIIHANLTDEFAWNQAPSPIENNTRALNDPGSGPLDQYIAGNFEQINKLIGELTFTNTEEVTLSNISEIMMFEVLMAGTISTILGGYVGRFIMLTYHLSQSLFLNPGGNILVQAPMTISMNEGVLLYFLPNEFWIVIGKYTIS
jgi:Right handed beta helix region